MLLTLTTHNRRLAEELATAESVTAKDSNYVDIFSLDFAFSFAEDIAKTSSLSRLKNIQQSLLDRVIVVLIIISRSTPSTLLARFIPITKIRNPLLKTLKNAAKSRILLACADRRTRQCYLTILLLTSIKKNRYYTRYTKHYNFNIYVSLATDTLHLLLKGLVIKMLDFMQDMLDDIYPSKQKAIIQQLIAIVSPLFISKAPFALYFIRALERMNVFKEEFRVYQQTLEEEKNFNYPKALDSICTRANSKAYYITIVKQFYSMINKKEYILQICLHNSQRTALLAANYATIVKQRIQPYLTKLLLSKVAANIAISNFIYAAAVFLYLILIIIDYTYYDKDRKHIAYIRAFSEILLFNNNKQIDNTTRMLSMPFKFYDLSIIIRLVHLVLRDLPNLITRTTMSYYINNYIN
ncbi:hypothetical protein HBI61_242850 [Parastagonospora nodorum]|nr:hypothetical protein HBI61_242850 [Parastagonospora nodorum]